MSIEPCRSFWSWKVPKLVPTVPGHVPPKPVREAWAAKAYLGLISLGQWPSARDVVGQRAGRPGRWRGRSPVCQVAGGVQGQLAVEAQDE